MPTLKQLRESRGWSQQYLAEQARLSLRTVARLEAGEGDARFNTMRRLADVLRVPVESIIIESKNTAVNE